MAERSSTFPPVFLIGQEAAAGRGLVFAQPVFFANSIWIFFAGPGWTGNGPGRSSPFPPGWWAEERAESGRTISPSRPASRSMIGKAPLYWDFGRWPTTSPVTTKECAGFSQHLAGLAQERDMTIQAGVKGPPITVFWRFQHPQVILVQANDAKRGAGLGH